MWCPQNAILAAFWGFFYLTSFDNQDCQFNIEVFQLFTFHCDSFAWSSTPLQVLIVRAIFRGISRSLQNSSVWFLHFFFSSDLSSSVVTTFLYFSCCQHTLTITTTTTTSTLTTRSKTVLFFSLDLKTMLTKH